MMLARATARALRPPVRPLNNVRQASSSAVQSSRPLALLRGTLVTSVVLAGGTLFAVYYFDSRSALHRYVSTPLLRHALDPEVSHRMAVRVLGSGLGPKDTRTDDELLATEIWGEKLSNPVGVAAGFDKNGEAIDGLFDLGFAWVEIGSVTPKPQPGNPRPRVFHLPDDDAMINRYGFPSDGAPAVLARLHARVPTVYDVPPLPSNDAVSSNASLREGALLAVNLGKNKSSPPESIADFVRGVHEFAPYADVLVVNVSSPNTPGLRGLQTRGMLQELLTGISAARAELSTASTSTSQQTRRPRIVLKIAPDLDDAQLRDVAEAVRESGGAVDGVIVSNTTIHRPPGLKSPNASESGGLSGAPLYPLSLYALRTLRTYLPASIPLIGCGGIRTGADALQFARAGASAVQLYTAFGYDGPGAPARVKDEIVEELRREGLSWGELVNRAVAELSLKDAEPVVGEQEGQERPPLFFEEGGVRALIREAGEIGRRLEELGKRFLEAGDEKVLEGASAELAQPWAVP